MSNNSQFSILSKSSKSTDYQTPKDLYDKLDRIFHFRLDPATSPENPLQTMRYYTRLNNGLKEEWDANTYINPPFGKGVTEWIGKMIEQSEKHPDCVYVMLLPARTETTYFQKYVCTENSITYFIRGRLKFVNPDLNKKNQPHIIGSVLWIRNASQKQLDDLHKVIPGVSVKW